MKTTPRKQFIFAALVLAAIAMTPTKSNAQTEPIVASVTVQNTLTITETNPLDFGTVAVVSDAADTATLAIDATTDTLAATTTGAPALFASIDSTTASAASITVEDGAPGATINFTINNVVNPIFGATAFTLNGFETSYNGGATVARVIGIPFQYVFDAAFAAGVNTLQIGAAIVTQVAVATYADGVYTGGFDVVASY